MKLLSPFQTKDKQQEELVRKITRIQEVEELATKANARLARAEADFADTLARNRDKWAMEEADHQNTLKDMQQEVQALENRKREALIPIQMYKDEADKIMAEAQKIVQRAKEREEQAEFLQEKLEEKLTEVSDRELEVKKEEERQEVAKRGIQSQQEQVKQGVQRLSEELMKFHEKQEQEEASLKKRKDEVFMAELNFTAKTEKYKRDLEALKILEVQLKDERETLQRAFARLQK